MTTMEDIAKQAGVALSTVSHALSGKRPVSAKTRERILQAMREMDYQPHGLARALATKRTHMIALFYPSLSTQLSRIQLDFINAAIQTVNAHEYALLLWTPPTDDSDIVRLIHQGFVDGLILMEVKLNDMRVPILKERQFPFSMIGHCNDNTDISYVDFDYANAVYDSVRYLYGLGHRRIDFINQPEFLLEATYGPAIRAWEGFERACQDFGISGTAYTSDSDTQAGYLLMQTILNSSQPPTGIVSNNDAITGGLARAIYEHGWHIPEDISYIPILANKNFDMTTPPLTAVELPVDEMGKLGVELLIRQLEGELTQPEQHLLRQPLIIRQSTAPARQ
jgi:DNA-binding LacI/PurR family transcriptional regulator